MKSLVRWSATVGLIAGTLVGSMLMGGTRALALTNEEVRQRLLPVPVFTITDDQGSPLVAAPSEGEPGSPVAGVFISYQDAQDFLNELTAGDPSLEGSVQVVPVSLAEVYDLAVSMRDQENRLEFVFVPVQQQVEQAVNILRTENPDLNEFEGVPLFLARSLTSDGSGYVTIRQGESEVVPMFFSEPDLQQLVSRLAMEQPDLAASIEIQVINLEGLISTLETSDNGDLNQIILVPPRESLELLQMLQTGGSAPGEVAPGNAAPMPQSTEDGVTPGGASQQLLPEGE